MQKLRSASIQATACTDIPSSPPSDGAGMDGLQVASQDSRDFDRDSMLDNVVQ